MAYMTAKVHIYNTTIDLMQILRGSYLHLKQAQRGGCLIIADGAHELGSLYLLPCLIVEKSLKCYSF